VINTNLPPVLHHFQDIAFDRSKIAIFGYPSCVLNPPTEGFPWDDLRKIFRGCQGMAKVLNGIETLQKISTGWVGCMSITVRQMTHRWDGRQHIASSRSLIKLLIVAALHSRCGRYILQLCFFLSFFFFSSPVLSSRRLDVYHTSTHDVVLVWI